MNKVELVMSLPWFACLGFAYSLIWRKEEREREREEEIKNRLPWEGERCWEKGEREENPSVTALRFPVIRALWEAGMQSLTSAHNEYWGVDVEGGISLFTEEWPWEWGRGLPLGIKEWALFLWRALLLFWSFLLLIDSIQTFLLPTRPAKALCLWDVHSPVSPSALASFSTVTLEKGVNLHIKEITSYEEIGQGPRPLYVCDSHVRVNPTYVVRSITYRNRS